MVERGIYRFIGPLFRHSGERIEIGRGAECPHSLRSLSTENKNPHLVNRNINSNSVGWIESSPDSPCRELVN